jgi:hypothetical protein
MKCYGKIILEEHKIQIWNLKGIPMSWLKNALNFA